MLKSKFNLAEKAEVEIEEEQRALEEDEAAPEEVEKKEQPMYPERRLHRAEVGVRLSLLGVTAEGDGYTYLKATCTGLELTEISAIKYFKHLQFLDFSDNHLQLEALQAITYLPHLVLIQADKNELNSAALRKMKYLQVIIMNHNKISNVQDVFQPELRTLEVAYNRIRRVYFQSKMPTIKCLDFRYNYLKDISDFDYPSLDSLYLAGNKISDLGGLERLVNLRLLHVRNNPIRYLNGFAESNKKLQYVNLRNCKVSALRQVKRLRVLTALETLVLKGCPYMGGSGKEEPGGGHEEDDADTRIEVVATLPRLKKLNKGLITQEERVDAKELLAQWLEEGEKDEEDDYDDDEEQDEESNLDE